MNLPAEFKEKMHNLLKPEYPLFLAEYERSAWQALRFNTQKKGLHPEQYEAILKELGIHEIQLVPWAKDAFYFANSNPVDSNTSSNPIPTAYSSSPACDINQSELTNHQIRHNISTIMCRPGKNPYHEIGLYYIQEPSAMSAAELLGVRPGERVLDLCAAPGGKSTQLAAALEGQGLLISNEINPSRAKILSQNIERMGITNAIVTSEDSVRLAERFGSYFHRILVDAPCSGEGMFRKNPDAVTEWSPQNVALCAVRQAEILDNAAQMLLPGGTLVYSTCTFSPEENEGTIGAFLERHQEFTVMAKSGRISDSVAGSITDSAADTATDTTTGSVPDSAADLTASSSVHKDAFNTMRMDLFAPGHPEWGNGNPALQQTHRLWPHKLHGEGHYAAVLIKAGQLPPTAVYPQSTPSPKSALSENQYTKSGKRNQKSSRQGSNPRSTNKQGANQNMDKAQSALLHEFLTATLSEAMTHWIEGGNLILFGDQLYRLPEDAPSLDGLRVLRAGLHIGTFRKNRFEPSHALALAIGPEDVKQALSLSPGEEAARYLRGESLSVSEIASRQAPLSPDSTNHLKQSSEDDTTQNSAIQQTSFPQIPAACKVQVTNGWILVCIDSYSAGWGKVTGDIIKNHYPKGLRKADLS